jgi:ADP-ribose pyrophosphatase YjhB (NUDIX family)
MGGDEVDCVGAVVLDGPRLLLVRRGHEPDRGRWSVPGGRVEPGESDAEAVVREVREETGLSVAAAALVGTVRRAAPGGAVYVIRDYRCTLAGSTAADARAGDDAADVGWFTADEVAGLDCTPGLLTALTEWGVLPGGL